MPQFGATFVPGGVDDYYLPEVVAPSPQRVTPQVPQNMQDDLQRMELEARDSEQRNNSDAAFRHDRDPSLSTYTAPGADQAAEPSSRPQLGPAADAEVDIRAYQNNDTRTQKLDIMGWDAPSFSPFPKVTGDNVPPADDAKEEILWNARKHVLHSQNVTMQISWARDVLTWAEVAMDAAAREPSDKARPATPRIEHELRVDALNIVTYLARQEHPDALYIRSKWLEFGKFGNRVDKREAYSGYKRAAELGNARSEYRMGMLFEQSNDMSKAKEHYYRGMSLKDSAALYRMGMMSLLGQHGETKDYPRGLERIQAAADGADEDAPQGSYVYGMLVGRDLPDITIPDGLLAYNLETAKMYVEKAAYLGFAKAQLKVGQAYELCQLGCEFNPSYSLHYYGLAAKQGLPEAALGVSRWFLFGYEGVFKKNEELAFRYAQEAAAAKLPTGEFAMGYYYEIGIHVNKSIPNARRWYQLAADHGNKDATGRLESLSQDRSLSKTDHETTTLTRIKSQHGSQRGKRPERFKQPQQMPTLNEGSGPPTPIDDGPAGYAPKPLVKPSSATASPRVSPQPSPGIRPTIVSEHATFPDPSRASVVGSDRQPAFNVRLDGAGVQPMRPQSAAPYPDDGKPAPLNVSRPRSTAPYPEDDVRGPPSPHFNSGLRPSQSPQADRPMSAFGINTQTGPRPMPTSHSAGSLQPPSQPPPRSRVASAGYDNHGPAPANATGRPYPGEDMQGRPTSAQQYPSGHPASSRMQKQPPRQSYGNPQGAQAPYPPAGADPARDYGPRTSSRAGSEAPPHHDPRMTPQSHERFSRVPGAAGRPERLSSLPLQDPQRPPRVPTGLGQAAPNLPRPGAGRTGSAPPGQAAQSLPSPGIQSPVTTPAVAPAAAPAKPVKGPATFEDMGIPQGKQEGDCVVM
ncbi:Chitin synthase regulatory factor 4 [Tolypocladium ophioglossoides CBS 100239]|uniref:Chitin synthase regulatory factor 4 n=1 Tax=Tolypocladium ophioglossoides (strain CBS 100239) TaxID=1163406 RepID=A0A0L0NA53_TOLOC|nr:Chitin synthase regulatory factor 4 [Tolypocladium ophioglossoides CBS 100239]